MKESNTHCLVTGGNGFIGSHMCRFLAEKGFKVSFLDDFRTSPKPQVHEYGDFYEVNLLNQQETRKSLSSIKPDIIYHFAGSALVSESEKSPLLYYQNNFVASLNLIEAYLHAGGKKMVFSSSCATYGAPADNKKISENTPQDPLNAYGRSKLLVENLLQDLGRLGKLNSIALRYFNVGGCHPDGTLGENHDPETHLIPNLVKAYLSKNKMKFQINGDQHPTVDGTCVRDFVHVMDLVDAHYLAYEYMESRQGYHYFNIGSGRGYSVKEVLAAFENILQEEIESEVCGPRPGDPPYLVADVTKAKTELNFKPRYSLEDCIRHTLDFLS